MLISISTACVKKSQLIAKLSLSPVISTGVHWNDMHVVNRGESLVACELTDCELMNNYFTEHTLIQLSLTHLTTLIILLQFQITQL
jgi:hypothetical protein